MNLRRASTRSWLHKSGARCHRQSNCQRATQRQEDSGSRRPEQAPWYDDRGAPDCPRTTIEVAAACLPTTMGRLAVRNVAAIAGAVRRSTRIRGATGGARPRGARSSSRSSSESPGANRCSAAGGTATRRATVHQPVSRSSETRRVRRGRRGARSPLEPPVGRVDSFPRGRRGRAPPGRSLRSRAPPLRCDLNRRPRLVDERERRLAGHPGAPGRTVRVLRETEVESIPVADSSQNADLEPTSSARSTCSAV